jgi:DNA-binding response OmpR family regulator
MKVLVVEDDRKIATAVTRGLAAEVLSLTERVEVPAGAYDQLVMTKDFTPLEPDVLELTE